MTKISIYLPREMNNNGVFDGSTVSQQIDPRLFNLYNIRNAERRFLLNNCLITKAMYNDMITERSDSPSQYNEDLTPVSVKFPSSAAYEKLWIEGNLKDYLTNAVLFSSSDTVLMRFNNLGIFTKSNPVGGSETIGIKGLRFLKESLSKNLETAKEMIKEFLTDNLGDYPLLLDEENSCLCNSCYKYKDSCSCRRNKPQRSNIYFY